MAAEIELLKINQYVQNLTEITGVDGAYVYGIDDNGNSVRIAIATIAAKAKDYSAEIQALQSALQQKTNVGHQHQLSDVNGLNAELTSVKDRLQDLEDADLDIDSELSDTSENPVQNKVIKGKIAELQTAINNKTDTTYSAGDGINIDGGNEISVKIDGETVTLDEQGRLKAAPAVTVDSELSNTSENPVQNKVIKTELDAINSRFVPQIDDLSKYEAQVGEIVQYKGESTDLYKKGYFYKFEGGSSSVTIPANTDYIKVTEDWEDVEKGIYTFQNWSNDTLMLVIITTQSQQYQADLITESGVTLPATNLNNLRFGWGYPYREEANFIRGGRWESSPVEIGDIVWDDEENIYKIKAVEIINGVLFLTLKIEKTAYKGKVKVGNADNFIDIKEALGTEFTCSFNIVMSGAGTTHIVSNIDDETKKMYKFGSRYYTRKTSLANIHDFYKVLFPIPMPSAHFHLEPLIGGKYIINTGDEPAVISTKEWTQINVQPTSSQGGGTDKLEMFLDSDTSTLILRDKELGVLSAIDFSVFTKDGMLTDAVLYNIAEEGIEVETPYLKLIFNTESGQKPIRVSLASLDISFAIDSELSATSHNAIENRIVTLALQSKASQTELDVVKQDVEDLRHSGAFLPTYDEETETLIY
jgi:hypothetical protein